MADAKQKEQAAKIAKQMKTDVVFMNSKGEFFTNDNLAQLSDKPENIETFDFTKQEKQTGKKENVVKHKVTEKDLKDNPEMAEAGIKVGDEIEFVPSKITKEQLKQLLSK